MIPRMTQEKQKEMLVINLMNKENRPPGNPDSSTTAIVAAPSSQMNLLQLKENYQAILKAKALFYPVAYQFQREIGKGRQGIVFLGLRQGARGCITQFAIKLFAPDVYRTVEEYWTDMGRIAHQLSRLQQLQSPHLISSHSYEETYGIGYIQMEVIDGLDLRRLLSPDHLEIAKQRSSARDWTRFTRTIFRVENDRICLQPGVAVYILRGILRGLERVHDANFLHSDIKPGNIMIDRLGNVKMIDFGRAVMIGEKVAFLFGSPVYMAPEIHRREVGGPHSDMYSLGLVALEMLRGERLAKDDPSEDKLLELKMDLPNRISSFLPRHVAVNQALVSILRKLIDPDPAKRFASAREAEVGEEGLRVIDKQLVRAGLDSEYARDLADYLSKLVDPITQRIELGAESHPTQRT
jgi:serine/threonine-protein kinase